MKPYTPTTLDSDLGYFELVIKVNIYIDTSYCVDILSDKPGQFFSCFLLTSSSILSIMQMYPQGRMSHHFREMQVGDYLSVKGPKVIIMFWASDLPSLGFFYFYRKHQLLSAEVNSNGFSLIPVWGLHFYCMHICLQLGGEYDFFSVVGSFQVPSWPSESIWNAGWWIRHYSNVPSNNQSRVLYCDLLQSTSSDQWSLFCSYRLPEQFLRTLMTTPRFI